MTERICNFPLLFKMSKGRVTCPDRLNSNFRLKGNCQICPKVNNNVRVATDFLTPGEKEGRRAAMDVRDGAIATSLKRKGSKGLFER